MRRVVILGGGYAGLHAFAAMRKRLRRELANAEVGITLVSRDPYHTYHGWTGEVLAGRLSAARTLTPIAPLLRDAYLEGEVERADLDGRTVSVRTAAGESRVLAFEHLLLATGSRDPFRRLPGLAEHGWRVKNTRDMQNLAARLETLDAQPEALRNVVVIGGGLAGVETASALARRFRDRGYTQATVHLVAARDRLLDGLRPAFTHIAERAGNTLTAQGIEIHAGRRVAAIAPSAVSFADGKTLSSDLTIATAGIELDVLPGTEGLPRISTGQLVAEGTLRVFGQPGIWAAGDIAAVQHPGTGEPCPTNALWAMKQGDCVGANIARALRGKPVRRLRFKGLGQAAGLDGRSGIAELYRLQFTGKLAWLLRISFFAWYMPSRLKGFSVMGELLGQWLAPAQRLGTLSRLVSVRALSRAEARLALGRAPRP